MSQVRIGEQESEEQGTKRTVIGSLKTRVSGSVKGSARTVWLDYVVGPSLAYTRRKAARTDDRNVYIAWVDPSDVVYSKLFAPSSLPVTGEDAVFGSVGGFWDRLRHPFRRHYVYRTLEARIVHGTDWEETPLAGRSKYRDQPEEFERKCEEIKRLIGSIRRNGYLPQSEIADQNDHPRKKRQIGTVELPDEVTVGMDRRGRLIHLRGGRHRLAAAQLLDIEEIPVILSMYHPKAAEEVPSAARRITVE